MISLLLAGRADESTTADIVKINVTTNVGTDLPMGADLIPVESTDQIIARCHNDRTFALSH